MYDFASKLGSIWIWIAAILGHGVNRRHDLEGPRHGREFGKWLKHVVEVAIRKWGKLGALQVIKLNMGSLEHLDKCAARLRRPVILTTDCRYRQ